MYKTINELYKFVKNTPKVIQKVVLVYIVGAGDDSRPTGTV